MHAHDSRWLHRPKMDWDRVAEAEGASSVEGRVLSGTKHIMQRRAATPYFHGAVPTRILFPEPQEIFAFSRMAPTGAIVCLFNFSEHTVPVSEAFLRESGASNMFDILSETQITIENGVFYMLPYGRVWVD